jgi:hypothetical protein
MVSDNELEPAEAALLALTFSRSFDEHATRD